MMKKVRSPEREALTLCSRAAAVTSSLLFKSMDVLLIVLVLLVESIPLVLLLSKWCMSNTSAGACTRDDKCSTGTGARNKGVMLDFNDDFKPPL